jgi:hypothetical protein
VRYSLGMKTTTKQPKEDRTGFVKRDEHTPEQIEALCRKLKAAADSAVAKYGPMASRPTDGMEVAS